MSGVEMRMAEKAMSGVHGVHHPDGSGIGSFSVAAERARRTAAIAEPGEGELRREHQHDDELQHLDEVLADPGLHLQDSAAGVERAEQEGREDDADGTVLGEHRDRDAVESVARREIVVEGLVDSEHLLRLRRARRRRRSQGRPQARCCLTSMPP